MSEQIEQVEWSMSITEAELKLLCEALTIHLDKLCDLIEEGTVEALDAYSQEELDTARSFLHKALHAEELEHGEGERHMLKCEIIALMASVDRATHLRDESLEALLP